MNQETGKYIKRRNNMTLTGKGQISVVPDVALIRLGVQTTGENLEEVQAENALLSQEVLEALREMGITDIRTIQYNIEKLYAYENDRRVDKGYSVRNILQIKLSDISQAGAVIDAAVSSRANVVEFITFEVSNQDSYYQEALNIAVDNAIDKALSIAENLGVPVNPIPIQITENSSVAIPFSTSFDMRERAIASTPIEPGNYQIEASVTVEFLY